MVKRAYADISEGQIHYRFEGSGEPLLLLHQTPFSSDEYSEMIPILARDGCRVIAMDTLGYGMSDRPPRPYLIEDYARSVVSFLDALGIQKTNVAGHHTGTSLATELAASYPERVGKLVLSGSSLYTPEEREERLNNPGRRDIEIDREGTLITREWQATWASRNPSMTPEIAFKFFKSKMLAAPHIHAAHHAAYKYEKEPKLPLIKSPTLLIYGSEDMFFEKREKVKSLIPRSKIQVIADASNQIANEKPREFARAILDFLKAPGL